MSYPKNKKEFTWTLRDISIERDTSRLFHPPIITAHFDILGTPHSTASTTELAVDLQNRLSSRATGLPEISKVIFNPPATIVLWSDKTKTVVKCQEGDIFDEEKGLAMAIIKKMYGNTGKYCDIFKKWVVEETPEVVVIDIKTTPLSAAIDNLQQKLYNALGVSKNIMADKSEPTGWISVKERLPEKRDSYVVYTSEGHTMSFTYDPVDQLFVTYWKENITHWMPMPGPPKEGE